MAYFTTTAPTSAYFGKISQYAKAYLKHRSDKVGYARLMRMSNRDLADMGITRNDIKMAKARSIIWHNV